jgi:malate dehydrogenase (oxaloacetate-decarboxylating)(NADP+)
VLLPNPFLDLATDKLRKTPDWAKLDLWDSLRADLLCSALVAQGLTLKDAQSRVYMFDVNGLLESTRKDLVDFQKPYAHQHAPTKDFVAAIESIKPTTIIGVSTIGGALTQKVVEGMSRINGRPVILALSNPTEHAECTAEQAYTWSKGKAIYAAGVQFAPVHYNGQTFLPGQANNFYIFPAVGMAIFATQAKRVSDEMFIEAAKRCRYQSAIRGIPNTHKKGRRTWTPIRFLSL